jgi:hypothetical protein
MQCLSDRRKPFGGDARDGFGHGPIYPEQRLGVLDDEDIGATGQHVVAFNADLDHTMTLRRDRRWARSRSALRQSPWT